MQKTGIEYIDYTWNPIAMRCTPCSPGCDNCWHLRMADRVKMNPTIPENERKALAGEGPFVLRERELDAPLNLRKPSVIGVQFMGDLLDVPREWIIDILDIIEKAKQHTFLILTKRSRDMFEFFAGSSGAGLNAPSIPNLWLGLTICNQQEADEKIPVFLQVPGKKFLSIEPMLGNIDLINAGFNANDGDYFPWCDIDLVILGGETGPHARPMHPDWVRSIRDQCQAAGVPFYFKQWGNFKPMKPEEYRENCYRDWIHFPDGSISVKIKNAGRLLDGREHNDLPWRVYERFIASRQ